MYQDPSTFFYLINVVNRKRVQKSSKRYPTFNHVSMASQKDMNYIILCNKVTDQNLEMSFWECQSNTNAKSYISIPLPRQGDEIVFRIFCPITNFGKQCLS